MAYSYKHNWGYMGVSENSGFSPQIIHLNRVFHYKPSISPILGNPHIHNWGYIPGGRILIVSSSN